MNAISARKTDMIFIPPTEIIESRDGYTITMEIPGLDKADIRIWSENNKLMAVSYTHLTLPTIYSV